MHSLSLTFSSFRFHCQCASESLSDWIMWNVSDDGTDLWIIGWKWCSLCVCVRDELKKINCRKTVPLSVAWMIHKIRIWIKAQRFGRTSLSKRLGHNRKGCSALFSQHVDVFPAFCYFSIALYAKHCYITSHLTDAALNAMWTTFLRCFK